MNDREGKAAEWGVAYGRQTADLPPLWETCPTCEGDGVERCDNPDHVFISYIGGEVWRLGCPCCGHDPEHRISGSPCPDCLGLGSRPIHYTISKFREWERLTGREPVELGADKEMDGVVFAYDPIKENCIDAARAGNRKDGGA